MPLRASIARWARMISGGCLIKHRRRLLGTKPPLPTYHRTGGRDATGAAGPPRRGCDVSGGLLAGARDAGDVDRLFGLFRAEGAVAGGSINSSSFPRTRESRAIGPVGRSGLPLARG